MVTSSVSRVNSNQIGELETLVTSSPGRLAIEGEITRSTVLIQNPDRFEGSFPQDWNIVVTVSGLTSLRNEIESALSELQDPTGISNNLVAEYVAAQGLRELNNRITRTVSPHNRFNIEVEFPTPRLPRKSSVAQVYGDQVAEVIPRVENIIPAMTVIVKASPQVGVLSPFSGSVQTKSPVDGDAVVETVDIGNVDCSELHSDIESDLNRIDKISSDALSSARSRAGTLTGEFSRLSELAGLGMTIPDPVSQCESDAQASGQSGGGSQLPVPGSGLTIDLPGLPDGGQDILDTITSSDIASINSSTLNNIESNVRETSLNVVPRGESPQSLSNDLDSIRGRIQDISQRCRPNYQDRLNTISERLSVLECAISRLRELKTRLLSLLSGASGAGCLERGSEIGDIASEVNQLEQQVSISNFDPRQIRTRASELESRIQREIPEDDTCYTNLLGRVQSLRSRIQDTEPCAGEIPDSLQNQVDRYNRRTNNYLSSLPRNRETARQRMLRDRGESLLSQARTENISDVCRDMIQGDISSSLSEIETATVRADTVVTCATQFADIDGRVENLEDRILNMSTPVSPGEVQSVARDAEELRDMIRSRIPAGSDCRTDFIERTDSALSSVEDMTVELRLTQTGPSEEQVERTKRLEELREQSLENIELIRDQLRNLSVPEETT